METYDSFSAHGAVAGARNMDRLLEGARLTVGRHESEERTLVVEFVDAVTVGLDVGGIFVGVHVRCFIEATADDLRGPEHETVVLYGDGTIADLDDNYVGHHDLRIARVSGTAVNKAAGGVGRVLNKATAALTAEGYKVARVLPRTVESTEDGSRFVLDVRAAS